MTCKQESREALREWITRASKKPDVEVLNYDTPIIEQRIISSIQVMDLLLFIEQLTGKPVVVEDLKPSAFRDINSICAAFLGEQYVV